MRENENINPERSNPNFLVERGEKGFKFEPTDALITFGRGIERVKMGAKPESVWKGTRLVQDLRVDPATKRGIRTGERKLGAPLKDFGDDDELKEMAAGANANILAALQWLELAEGEDALPKKIIFSGGRPGYLEKEDPSITEAGVMSKEFIRRAGIGKKVSVPVVEVLTGSKNTAGDLRDSLLEALKSGCKSATVVNVSWAMERTRAFYEHDALVKNPDLKGIKVNFVTSDALLISRYGQRVVRVLANLKNTKAYKYTIENERIGVNKLTKGTYTEGQKPGAY